MSGGTIERLLDALSAYAAAKAERDAARDECDSDWGYFGCAHEKSLKNAKDEVRAHLREFILLTIQDFEDFKNA